MGNTVDVNENEYAVSSFAEKLAAVRTIRDQIRAKIETWCDEVCATLEKR